MGKKKLSNNNRGVATVWTPSNANDNKSRSNAAAVTKDSSSKPKIIEPSKGPDPQSFRIPNPVALKKKRRNASATDGELQNDQDLISKHVANFAKDYRLGRLVNDIAKQRKEGYEQGIIANLSQASEHLLVEHLLSNVASKFTLNDGIKDMPSTQDSNKLMRDMHLVYVTCKNHLEINEAILRSILSAAPEPWNLTSVLHTLCLTLDGDRLPLGWSDKSYVHQSNICDAVGEFKATPSPLETDVNLQLSSNEKDFKEDDFDIDLDHLNIFDLPASTCTTPANYTTPDVLSFDITGWTGKVPKQLLRDIMVREDNRTVITYPDQPLDNEAANLSTKAFRVQCVINGQSYSGPLFCKTRLEAEHYAAVIGLYQIAKGRPLYRMLPPAYSKIWRDIEQEEKRQINESQFDAESQKAIFLQSLVDKFNNDGLIGPERALKFPQHIEPLVNPESRAIGYHHVTHSNYHQKGRFHNNSPRRNPRIQAQRLNLPVAEYQTTITGLVDNHQVVLICGETGSGKTTQVPQFILEGLINSRGTGQIFCTQPRRISATSIAARVSDEWGSDKLGGTVGFSVKLETKTSNRTRLIFCTTGILLRRLETDPSIHDISHVIVDEVHERSLDSDFLLVMLRRLLSKRPDLRLILMSATINEQQFSQYFDNCPILSIPGRTHPVTTLFVEDIINRVAYKTVSPEYKRELKIVKKTLGTNQLQFWEEQVGMFPEDTADRLDSFDSWVKETAQDMDPVAINFELIKMVVQHIMTGQYDNNNDHHNLGAIVVFLPGIREIGRMMKVLHDIRGAYLLPLHSTLSQADQARVFLRAPEGLRKVVVSTNIAETGITIPDAVFVIDSGKAKFTRYDEKKHLTRLKPSFITQANCRQRKGRAGRVRAGFYFAMYSQYRHDYQMAEYEMPEVQRMALESTALKIKVHRFDDIVGTFNEFLDPPPTSRVHASIERLIESKALDEKLNLTPLGCFLGELPLDIDLGKILAFGAFYGCVEMALIIAAYLSVSLELFNSSVGWGHKSGGSTARRLIYGRSDLLTAAHIFKSWKRIYEKNGEAAADNFCNRHELNKQTLTILDDTCSQLIDLLPINYDFCNRHNDNTELLHIALLAASYPKILRLDSIGGFKYACGVANIHGKSLFADYQIKSTSTTQPLSPFFCYFTCIQAAQLLVFDLTNVDPILMAFAVGCQHPLNVNYVAQTISFDKDLFARVRIPQKTMAHLVEFHNLLTESFEHFMVNPRSDSSDFKAGNSVDVLQEILSVEFAIKSSYN